MEIESWDTDRLTDQERIFARHKATGTPITGGDELTAVDYGMNDPVTGDPVVGRQRPDPAGIAGPAWRNPAAAERLQRHRRPGSRRRQTCRGAVLHRFPARSARPFTLPQTRLGRSDLLNEYIAHSGGGLWACPHGVKRPRRPFGKGLFG
jgi:deferrochelatase/peroxidase EfeB